MSDEHPILTLLSGNWLSAVVTIALAVAIALIADAMWKDRRSINWTGFFLFNLLIYLGAFLLWVATQQALWWQLDLPDQESGMKPTGLPCK